MRTALLLPIVAISACGVTDPNPLNPELATRNPDPVVNGYYATQLPSTPAGRQFRVAGIAEDGSILSRDGDLFHNGQFTALPREPGASADTYYETLAIAPNKRTVGYRRSWANPRYHSVVTWASPTATPIAVSAIAAAQPTSINSAGTIVGRFQARPFAYHPDLGLRFLTVEGRYGAALRVSENGWIAGFGYPGYPARQQAVRWSPDGQVTLLTGLMARGIREDGAVVGHSGNYPWFNQQEIEEQHSDSAIFWSVDGARTRIGPVLEGTAPQYGAAMITEKGRIVGWSNTHGSADFDQPWTLRNGQLIMLPRLQVPEFFELYVNACGIVAGGGLVWRKFLGQCD